MDLFTVWLVDLVSGLTSLTLFFINSFILSLEIGLIVFSFIISFIFYEVIAVSKNFSVLGWYSILQLSIFAII